VVEIDALPCAARAETSTSKVDHCGDDRCPNTEDSGLSHNPLRKILHLAAKKMKTSELTKLKK
jgi:hypothetical protein